MLDDCDYEQLAQEHALWPWLDDDSMADSYQDLLADEEALYGDDASYYDDDEADDEWTIFDPKREVTLTGVAHWILCSPDQENHYGPYEDTPRGRMSLIAMCNHPGRNRSTTLVVPCQFTVEGQPAYVADWSKREPLRTWQERYKADAEVDDLDAYPDYYEHDDYSGAFDGFCVTSDADPGL